MKLLTSIVMATVALLSMTNVACAGNATGGQVWQPKGHPYTLSRTPIPAKVFAEEEITGVFKAALKDAMAEFPCKMFVLTKDKEEADIIIRTTYLPETVTARMVMGGPDVDWMLLNEVKFPWFNVAGAYIVFLHELGHAAGLAHDKETAGMYWKSVMLRNSVKYMHNIEKGRLLPMLYPGDEKAMKERYCTPTERPGDDV